MAQLTQSSSHSSDYFDNDPEFIKAIAEVEIPTSISPPPLTQRHAKRPRSPDDVGAEEGTQYHGALSSVADGKDGSYLESHTYGAARFGEFGEYMSRKRAKLQIQNAEMDVDEGSDQASKIFSGLQIYINGWTEPSVQDLRQMIIQYGGTYHAYLDKKSLVTHIITCSLTPAKVREFKHMKVVRPEWLVDSIQAGTLLPWQDFVFRPGERVEGAQGRKVAQKSLFEGFASQASHLKHHTTRAVTPEPTTRISGHDLAFNEAGPSGSSVKPATPPRTPKKQTLLSPRKPGPTTPSRPLHTSDPATSDEATRVPGYAAHKSNPNAERAMQDPAWRAAHTSVAPDFIEGYYKNSRLHHLSTWKAELKNLVTEAQERAENGAAEAWSDLGCGAGPSPSPRQSVVERIVQENIGGRGRRRARRCLRA